MFVRTIPVKFRLTRLTPFLNNLVKNLYIIVCFFTVTALGQVLLPTPETAFESQHNFNPELIKAKGIKKIVFEIVEKKDFEVAIDRNLVETYEFNADGLLSRHYYTTIVKTLERKVSSKNKRGRLTAGAFTEYLYDTVSTSYFYDDKKLILKRYHDGLNYYESRYYRYNSDKMLTKELCYKETNESADRSVFILGNQVLLSEDSFQYQKFSDGRQIKCMLLNNENRPYKERISNFDSLRRKISVNENYTAAGWIMQENIYEYEGNKLVMAQFEGNANNNILLKNLYSYDSENELYSEKQFKNDVLVKEISYVTVKGDSLLNSMVIRDPLNKTLRIVKLKYDMDALGKNGR